MAHAFLHPNGSESPQSVISNSLLRAEHYLLQTPWGPLGTISMQSIGAPRIWKTAKL